VLIVLSFFLLPSGALIARFGGALQASELPTDTREEIWAESLHLVRRFPLFGCGFGAFESAFMRHQVTAPMTTVNYAHNDYLQLLAELGLTGFVPLIGLAILLYKLAIQRLRSAADDYERHFYVACIGAMTAMTLHSFVDFNLYMPANAIVLSWISAMATGPNPVIWTVEPPRKAGMRNFS
jgi:O-antigen ligase